MPYRFVNFECCRMLALLAALDLGNLCLLLNVVAEVLQYLGHGVDAIAIRQRSAQSLDDRQRNIHIAHRDIAM